MTLDGGVQAIPKILVVYMGKAALPTDPTRSVFGNYASGCYNVALATR